jgi:ABC-type Zn uptake system ZnuABC Zn-binding protein ZnuA
MVAQNIRNGLRELITNTSLLEVIDRNYEELRLLLSTFDADFNLISQNATNRTIIAANKAFDFLTRYGFEVINIAEDEPSSTAVTRAGNAFRANENNYLFILRGTYLCEDVQSLVDAGATLIWINPMFNLTDEERLLGDNYITFMNQFLAALRTEVF